MIKSLRWKDGSNSSGFQLPCDPMMEIHRSGNAPAIRKDARILITNPDMLHLGISPASHELDAVLPGTAFRGDG